MTEEELERFDFFTDEKPDLKSGTERACVSALQLPKPLCRLAEAGGLEPPVGCPAPVLETGVGNGGGKARNPSQGAQGRIGSLNSRQGLTWSMFRWALPMTPSLFLCRIQPRPLSSSALSFCSVC